ncbi:NAD(P)/FAD-dependent oxidoreductase [Mesorhizobium sp. M1403]|uniref:phytoene desaturase family protein n=1 Tax=Mesorhizobium sp. M1403 TaxID=2957097 RepID=UPI0033396FEC
MTNHYDAVVLGGGHNGLVCAAYLARAGMRTAVLERRHAVGGAAFSDEVFPGFTFSVFSYGLQHLYPQIIKDLDLGKFGLKAVPYGDLFSPTEDGRCLITNDNVAATAKNIEQLSTRDAEAYPKFVDFHNGLAAYMRHLGTEVPPDPTASTFRDVTKTLAFSWRNFGFRTKMFDFVELMTQSAEEYLSHWFENNAVRAMFAYQAGIGNFVGPHSRGSALACLYNMLTDHSHEIVRGHVIGGMGTVSKALAASAQSLGVEIHTNAEVEHVIVDGGKLNGVATKNGREYRARIVASSMHSKILFGKVVERKHLPDDLVQSLEKFNTVGTNWKINVACNRPPQLKCLGSDTGRPVSAFVHIGPTIDYLEKAYDDAKYGKFAQVPWMTVATPTYLDKSMAPEGKHVVNLYGGHVPYKLREGDWSSRRSEFVQTVWNVLDEFVPGFTNEIIDYQVLLPTDIENILNIPGGNILHGQMTPDQLFSRRPYPHYADYRTPIQGLYQCGSSCHPGGGVTGLPGFNAVREILRDRGKKRS